MSRTRFLQSTVIGTACLMMVCGADAAAVPTFAYDATTGTLQLDAGLDAGTTMVSWLIQGPQALEILAFQDGTFDQGSSWVQGYFGGKEQWIAVSGDGVNGLWDVARYETVLDLGVFGTVEYGLRLSDGSGETGFTTVILPPTLDGDLNGDGFVGIADLDIVLGNWNLNVPPADPAADPSGDGFVGIADLDIVLGNWNAGTPPTSQIIVPEMASVSVMIFAMLGLARRGRRRCMK